MTQTQPNRQITTHTVPVKRRRITKACDWCHSRGRRCAQGPDHSSTCLTCIEFGVTCTWNRVAAKRGVKPRTQQQQQSPKEETSTQWVYLESRHGPPERIAHLIDVFFDTIFPIFPLFDEKDFRQSWEQRTPSRAIFACLMAVCALSSSHIKHGAVFSPLQSSRDEPDSTELFLAAAQSAVPETVVGPDTFRYVQALSILCLTANEIGDFLLYHNCMGAYHTISAQANLHNEQSWPGYISNAERQTRRRLFWSIYRLEVHSALVMGHMVRCPENQSAVAYPEPLDRNGEGEFWLELWNLITDMYRCLSMTIIRFRARQTRGVNRGQLQTWDVWASFPLDECLQQVSRQRQLLTHNFRNAKPRSNDDESNKCGFQIANIICTHQLLKMAAAICEDATFEDACEAALVLIDEISKVPVEYLRAIGSPMVQELAGVGHLLTSFVNRLVSASSLQRLRQVINAVAQFLDTMGPVLPHASGAGVKLYQQVERIDQRLRETQEFRAIEVQQLNHRTAPETAPAINAVFPGHESNLTFMNDPFIVPLEVLQQITWPNLTEAGPINNDQWHGGYDDLS